MGGSEIRLTLFMVLNIRVHGRVVIYGRVVVCFLFVQSLEDLDAAPVRDELRIWRENYVNIQDLMDEYTTLKERSQLLRDEVG